MPRYFFDLADHENVTDTEGLELADNDAARMEAIIFAGAYLREHPDLVWDGQEIRIHVLNEERTPIFVVVVLSFDLVRDGGK